MNKNKLIVSLCPNYYRIVNFDYFEDDIITEKLIKVYKSYIFHIDLRNKEEIKGIKQIDFVLGKYIDDYLFRHTMQNEFVHMKVKKTCADILKSIIDGIIRIFYHYEEETTKHIYIAKWI